ncbi:TetR/AcrR family transcriptional regulator [Streptomyces sp. NPDC059506]|uniref:TetR family transcriptional regulator n=1 Tax=Streptomyces thermolineatus TaxID=44033 RepID=A0ABP5YV90_9ACTN|nr:MULTISPECIES: TetR/AcrR family transcriptional regulator [unclassified Streptomyces]MCZ2523904.1 TetR/AcrR family transcriptional regulator [Streptomyces sp. HB2AG]
MNAPHPREAGPGRAGRPDGDRLPLPLRRTPQQRRSVERVERILDAAVDLLVEEGYQAATTTRIAGRAGVGLATLYSFFADRRAVYRAASVRNLDAFLDRLDRLLSGARFDHWWEAAAAGFDEYVRMSRAEPGFRALRFGDVADDRLLAGGRRNDEVVVERIVHLVVRHFGAEPDERMRTSLLVAVAAVDALVRLAFELDPERGDPAVLAEARQVAQGILARGAGA